VIVIVMLMSIQMLMVYVHVKNVIAILKELQ